MKCAGAFVFSQAEISTQPALVLLYYNLNHMCNKIFYNNLLQCCLHKTCVFILLKYFSLIQNTAKKNNSIDDVEAFLKKNSKKRMKAVVESVIDGSTIKLLLLPEGNMITLYLSGIKVRYFFFFSKHAVIVCIYYNHFFKLVMYLYLINCIQCPPESVEFGDEAKFFVEVRLLQKDVEVTLEGVLSNNKTPSFFGTIHHPVHFKLIFVILGICSKIYIL